MAARGNGHLKTEPLSPLICMDIWKRTSPSCSPFPFRCRYRTADASRVWTRGARSAVSVRVIDPEHLDHETPQNHTIHAQPTSTNINLCFAKYPWWFLLFLASSMGHGHGHHSENLRLPPVRRVPGRESRGTWRPKRRPFTGRPFRTFVPEQSDRHGGHEREVTEKSDVWDPIQVTSATSLRHVI